MRKLFFDIQITGHHSEYISHLIDYLFINNNLTDEYFFVVHPEFSERFPEIALKAKKLKNIVWIEIGIEEFNKSQRGSLIRSSFSLYKIMDSYAKQYKVDHVILLYFNTFQLSCIFYRSHYSISGILFLQFYRMNKNKIADKLKYYRKYLITKLYTLNNKIDTIFVLNDQKTVNYLNNEFRTSQFKMLPDPVPILSPIPGFDIYEHYNIDRNRKIFLHIGSLGDRKGTFEIIEAVKYIQDDMQNEIAILLVGKANEHETQLLSLKLKKVIDESKITVLWDKQFVSSETMKSLFDQCFAVLIPYKNAEASSGILGHAAAANKAVIAPKSGLLKDIIEDYNLGVLIDRVESNLIADAIESLADSNYSLNKNQDFIGLHTTDIFVKKLLCKNYL